VVTAGAPDVPHPLMEQLAIGGRLVIPEGSRQVQTLQWIRRKSRLRSRFGKMNC
jgi:protein-L-isoaspartate(D-aspartate) O-methyltransferase